MNLPMATVCVQIGEVYLSERAAVAPVKDPEDERVIYSLKLNSVVGTKLVSMLASSVKSILPVQTRAMVAQEEAQEEQDRIVVAREQPTVTPVMTDAETILDTTEESGKVLGSMDEESGGTDFGIGRDASAEGDEDILFALRKGKGECEGLIELPPVPRGKSRELLVKETKADPSLQVGRRLADKEEKGFRWDSGLLVQSITNHMFMKCDLIVLPKQFREQVLRLAHDQLGHMGRRKVTEIVKRSFTWPGLTEDVLKYCRSCETCQCCSKVPAGKVPMVERQVTTEPFEALAFDLVGPLPKAKGGFRFILTSICMATKWPEAIPLKSITARAVAQGMVDIFARTGIPLQLLTDQGSQFIGALVKQLCMALHIDKIQTTPYRPETNGVIERMHGTLGSILRKASSQGLDWVQQLPFALFALRAAHNRDTKFSPYELIYGRQVKTPLDILHAGWSVRENWSLDVSSWGEILAERLELMRDIVRERAEKASGERKVYYDKKSVQRELMVGDSVWCRIPGMDHKLKEAWHGPYPVMERISAVDYRVDIGRGRKKVLHINNLKKHFERENEVLRLTVVAEDFSEDKE